MAVIPNKEPMNYPKEPKAELGRTPNVDDMINHMCVYIESDTLGQIDNTHLALADQLGVESEECLRLAEKHSKVLLSPNNESYWPLSCGMIAICGVGGGCAEDRELASN